MKKWFYPLGLVTLLGFAMLYLNITKDEVVSLDHKMSNLLGGSQFITAFHYFGDTKFILLIALLIILLLWIRSHNYRGMLFVLFTVGVGNALNQLLKKVIQRERPDVSNQLETFSFPSGHAMVGLLYLFTIAYLATEHQTNKKISLTIWSGAILMTIMIGLSRIAESRHYASDVFAGWMAGYTWFILVAIWYELRKRNRKSKKNKL
ncbi:MULTISPECIES: phosphatase PAP2 family protein [Psychrobacillus]|uniref:Phosphatase PAP2 family protein n=1 Tax=Psychrobacillus faecigallinarum TaxID=2762235 RepID=A0ABR8RE65_9BACI|nr:MULTISPECIES: phosphatase PAP2 family protein [Psychrobacillus]MBD7946082.1 phosphatase PAP2 family protein [Psychrobacillus faecigallinarum]QEY21855.1 PAP2 family protein [Psychrobacillus sp. AK 1817]QGM32312.1 phosphatase PAP2 family protein [Bacillus sp. N3536]